MWRETVICACGVQKDVQFSSIHSTRLIYKLNKAHVYVFHLISQKFPQRCLPNRSTVRPVECCFTSTKTVGLLGMGAQDGHLDFHTASELCTLLLAECCFTSTETVGLLGTGAQDGHLDLHTAPELLCLSVWQRPLFILSSSSKTADHFLFLRISPASDCWCDVLDFAPAAGVSSS